MKHYVDAGALVTSLGSGILWVLGWLPALLACVASGLSIAWYVYQFRNSKNAKN